MTNPNLTEVLASENEKAQGEIEVLQDSDLVDVAGGLRESEELEWCISMSCGSMKSQAME